MTPEQKAKAYDEAIEKIRKGIQPLQDGSKISGVTKGFLEEVFPELCESEDERIRKSIIAIINNYVDNSNTFKPKMLTWLEKQGQKETTLNKENKNNALYIFNLLKDRLCSNNEYDKDILGAIEYCIKNNRPLEKEHIAWLENQGNKPQGKSEQEAINEELVDNANKVEPKFEIERGKWYVCNTSRYTDFIVGEAYYCPKNGMLKPNENTIARYVARDCFHPWTIADAKDGDVLHSTGFHNDCIFIFNRLDNWKFDEPNGDRAVATGYCCLFVSADNMGFGMQGPDCIEVNTVKPATKIQRDLLFQKMHEAGYEWDANNKKLKEIE